MRCGHGGRRRDALGWALALLVSTSPAAAQEFAGREKLRAHGEQEFRKDIVTVADGVYVAVGYSMANVTLIVGDGGAIIVDTTSKIDDAQAVTAAFAKISNAPVRAIIITHSHPDHTGGASVFRRCRSARDLQPLAVRGPRARSWPRRPRWRRSVRLHAARGVVYQRRHGPRVRASVGTCRDEDR
jgi:hypothetical protein